MGNDTVATTAPTPTGASVAFLCGTAAFDDGFLTQGKKWVKQIQSASGGAPQVQVGDLGRDIDTVTKQLTEFSRNSATAAATNDVLDQHLGGFRGHALVIVTHGLEDHDPKTSPEDKEKTQGLLFFNLEKGQSDADIVFFKMHLDFMVAKDGGVTTKPELDTLLDDGDGKKFKADVHAFAPFVDALKKSVYTQVYFAACGGGRRLEKFANALHDLTGKSIFFNTETIFFPDGGDIFATVGPLTGNVVRDGKKYYSQATVKLKSKTDNFLEGSMARVL